MCIDKFKSQLAVGVVASSLFLAAPQALAITVERDPIQGAGFVEVDLGPLPLVVGAPVGTPLEYDVVFTDMRHIELMEGATTTVEFGIGNTGNNVDLDYRIVFDLSDMNGNLITNDALVVEGTANAGTIRAHNLDLTPLPAVIFHDFHVLVETSFAGGATGGMFDFYMAGGGGGGAVVSGPVVFNRAIVGEWIPEPATSVLCWFALAGMLLHRRQAPG